jgi:hypothetical protein
MTRHPGSDLLYHTISSCLRILLRVLACYRKGLDRTKYAKEALMKNLPNMLLCCIAALAAASACSLNDKTSGAPGQVIGLQAVSGPGQVKLTWTDPLDVDFDHVNVFDKEASDYPTPVQKGVQTFTFTNLVNGKAYTFGTLTYNKSGKRSDPLYIDATPHALQPEIDSFTADPESISNGGTSNLTATFENGAGKIEPGSVQVITGVGTTVGPLSSTTTYTLTVTNDEGASVQKTVTVTVN